MRTRTIELSTNNHQQAIVLPVNPKKITVTSAQKNQTLDLLNMGEVLSLGNRGLVSLSLSSFFPARGSPLYRLANRAPWDYYNLLNGWKTGKTIVRLIIGGTQVNLATTIEKLNHEIVEGDGDLNYTIDLKEYRRLNVPTQQHSTVQQANGLLDRPDVSTRPKEHIVRSADDTFWYIACRYYGDGALWRRIALANGRELADDVHIGDRLVLP